MLHKVMALLGSGVAVWLGYKQMFPATQTKSDKDDLARVKRQKRRLAEIKRREQMRTRTRL